MSKPLSTLDRAKYRKLLLPKGVNSFYIPKFNLLQLTDVEIHRLEMNFPIAPIPAVLNNMARSTGGTITLSGGYRIHTFTSSGDFVAGGSGSVEYLLVGGGSGGNGGTDGVNFPSGGGSGQVRSGSSSLVKATFPVVVGAGGAAVVGFVNSNPGAASTFNGVSAGGGLQVLSSSRTGGGNGDFVGGTLATSTNSGGGAGAGQNGSSSTGGNGVASSISGSSVTYGGGGAGRNGGSYGTGGTGGGGNNSVLAGTDGLGGGAAGNAKGGNGVVIIRYLI